MKTGRAVLLLSCVKGFIGRVRVCPSPSRSLTEQSQRYDLPRMECDANCAGILDLLSLYTSVLSPRVRSICLY